MATLLQVVLILFPSLRRDFNYFSNSFNSDFNYFQDSECYPFRECCALRAGEASTFAMAVPSGNAVHFGQAESALRKCPATLGHTASGADTVLGYAQARCMCTKKGA